MFALYVLYLTLIMTIGFSKGFRRRVSWDVSQVWGRLRWGLLRLKRWIPISSNYCVCRTWEQQHHPHFPDPAYCEKSRLSLCLVIQSNCIIAPCIRNELIFIWKGFRIIDQNWNIVRGLSGILSHKLKSKRETIDRIFCRKAYHEGLIFWVRGSCLTIASFLKRSQQQHNTSCF